MHDAEVLPLLACPACRGGLHTGFACVACGTVFASSDGIPVLRRPGELDRDVERVREFYTEQPFPDYPERFNLSALRARAARSELARLLDAAIPGNARVVEVGCGTGQMSLYLATAERVVVGADLCRASLALGAAAARRFSVDRVRFVETDLFEPGLADGAFDVVYSSGVLHHTPDPEAAFASLARLARPGGLIILGLYNSYARIAHRLRRFIARATRYRWTPFDPVLRDRAEQPARRRAWLRDQYEHPLEHRHTLREVKQWFRSCDVGFVRAYPSSVLAEEPLAASQMFEPCADDWAFEQVLVQLGWARTLAHEGGLFVTIGRRHAVM